MDRSATAVAQVKASAPNSFIVGGKQQSFFCGKTCNGFLKKHCALWAVVCTVESMAFVPIRGVNLGGWLGKEINIIGLACTC